MATGRMERRGGPRKRNGQAGGVFVVFLYCMHLVISDASSAGVRRGCVAFGKEGRFL